MKCQWNENASSKEGNREVNEKMTIWWDHVAHVRLSQTARKNDQHELSLAFLILVKGI